ncbi:uncharacterized protein LOC119729248 [Patiria miniata]|uniref:Sushi domain-containing protein n=1 Tax=Patiria miniata TaxID=46514 RepID=A0A914A2B9_PATMI|nr:uncharacterized protein LOC119729248 [Patiria miniata]
MERHCQAAILHVLILLYVSVVSSSCPPPPKQLGTNCSDETIVNFQVNYKITCTCMFGYNPVGDLTRTCTESSTWTGSDDICRIDAVSVALACFAGLAAILIFTTLSCCLISRDRRRRRRAERRLTIQRREEEAANAGLNGPAQQEPDHYTRTPSTKERSDSGLQTDLDMEDIDFNDFSMEVDSPTDNNPPEGLNLDFIEE